jgi:hypothetical protein
VEDYCSLTLIANRKGSTNDYHSVVMAVVVMVTPMTMAIRLCISRGREEGDESEHQ